MEKGREGAPMYALTEAAGKACKRLVNILAGPSEETNLLPSIRTFGLNENSALVSDSDHDALKQLPF